MPARTENGVGLSQFQWPLPYVVFFTPCQYGHVSIASDLCQVLSLVISLRDHQRPGLCAARFRVVMPTPKVSHMKETVAMSAIYIHAGAAAGGVNELKSLLLQIMHPMKRPGC